MIIRVTIFNDPNIIGESRKQKIKQNYSFFVHNGTPNRTKVFFTSWAAKTKGQRKAYKKPFEVQARKAIPYFKIAIEEHINDIKQVMIKYTDVKFDGTKFFVDHKGLMVAFTDIANRIKERAKDIIRDEAYDTGDLMNSVSISQVEIIA